MAKSQTHVTPTQASLIEQAKAVLMEVEQAQAQLDKAKAAALEVSGKLQDAFPFGDDVFAGKQSAVVEGLKLAYSRIGDSVDPYAGENWDTIANRAHGMKEAQHVLRYQIDKPTLKVQPADLLKKLRVKRIEGNGYNFKASLAE